MCSILRACTWMRKVQSLGQIKELRGGLMSKIPVREALGSKDSDSREFPSTDV